jgi:hypothetical protein
MTLRTKQDYLDSIGRLDTELCAFGDPAPFLTAAKLGPS